VDQIGDAMNMNFLGAVAMSAVFTLTALAAPPQVLAQWSVVIDVGSDRFWGGSVENAREHRSFRPYRPTTFGAGLHRGGGRLGLGLVLRYTEASLALEGDDAVVAVKGVFTVYSASPEVTYRIAAVGVGNQLVLHAGPLFEVWNIIDEESQMRVGAQGAVSLTIPLGGRIAGTLLAGAALTSSPFTRDQLDPSYDLRALWRRRFAVGLQYRL
jgi:hypothetical protein